MFKKLFLPIILVGGFIILVGTLNKTTQGEKTFLTPILTSPKPGKATTLVEVNGKKLTAKVSDTPSERQQGLSGVKSLSDTEGMLFVFDDKDTTPKFWMKDMLMAIDIIWIDDNKIVKIDNNIPYPPTDTPDNKLIIYDPGAKIDYVLETNSSFSEKANLQIGNTIKFSL